MVSNRIFEITDYEIRVKKTKTKRRKGVVSLKIIEHKILFLRLFVPVGMFSVHEAKKKVRFHQFPESE